VSAPYVSLTSSKAFEICRNFSTSGNIYSFLGKSFLTGGSLVVFFIFIGFLLIPRLTRDMAKSQELLFLFSICWCFVVAATFSYFNFSLEIGALLAGVFLAFLHIVLK